MKRILFVDDEPRILDGLRRMLRPHRDQWEMVFAEGGEQAIAALEKAPFDVVVSDMRMPGVDGLALLTLVRDLYPNAARIMLSGHTEMETALRTIPIAHQFLSKPCDAALVQQVIERACRLEALVRNEAIRKDVGAFGTLPSCPRVYQELNTALANPETSLAEITYIVEQDIAISARILHVVNSGFFGMPRRISSVQTAVGYLGAGTIKSLALSMGVFEACKLSKPIPDFSIEAEQRHALATANIAGTLFEDRQLSAEAFTAGMLHDVGRLILASRVSVAFARMRASRPEAEVEHETETRTFGFSHAEIGAYLLGLWGLPYPIVEAVGFHHAPERLQQKELDTVVAVHIADALAHETMPEAARTAPRLDLDYMARLGVADKLDGWRARAQRFCGAASPETPAPR